MTEEEHEYEDDLDVDEHEDESKVAEEMAVCTCPDLLKGHHAGCPYVKARG